MVPIKSVLLTTCLSVQNQRASDPRSTLRAQWVTRRINLDRDQRILSSQCRSTEIRASGPGGQNVNKVSTAIHLRFDVKASSLPETVKSKLLELRDTRINTDGVIVIKAQKFRSQEKNKLESLERLDELLQKSQYTDKPRRKTRPSRSAVRKRLDSKKKQGSIKKNRGKVDDY